MYYLLIPCLSFKVFAIPDLSQHVKSSYAFFSKLRKWTYHICVLNPRHEPRERMHRGYMPNYYRNNSMYSRPLVGRLKTRLSVNFVHKNSQTVYNSKV